jgi:hypothetical protein
MHLADWNASQRQLVQKTHPARYRAQLTNNLAWMSVAPSSFLNTYTPRRGQTA